MVLIMTVEPGFGGQSYMKDMDEKIKWAAKMADTKYSHLEVEVDGGVGVKTAALAAKRCECTCCGVCGFWCR